MKEINNILLCGLGGVGSIYAQKIIDNTNCDLKILVDKSRFERYSKTPRRINGKDYTFDYILPSETDYDADLIIIASKSSGLDDIIKNINNFVKDDTIILSFINGITSEERIAKVYGYDKILYSYIICHTIFRTGSEIKHDGVTKVVFGSKDIHDTKIKPVKELFDSAKLDYEIPQDMYRALWLKYALNCCVNQTSAITKMTFKQMWESQKYLELLKNICNEIAIIAKANDVNNTETFWAETYKNLLTMLPEGKTSMLQDIEAKRKPETDLFGKTVVKLGEENNISTPYNKILSELIDIITENFD